MSSNHQLSFYYHSITSVCSSINIFSHLYYLKKNSEVLVLFLKTGNLLCFEFNFKYAPSPFQSQLQVTCSISKGPTKLLWSLHLQYSSLTVRCFIPYPLEIQLIWDGILFTSNLGNWCAANNHLLCYWRLQHLLARWKNQCIICPSYRCG